MTGIFPVKNWLWNLGIILRGIEHGGSFEDCHPPSHFKFRSIPALQITFVVIQAAEHLFRREIFLSGQRIVRKF